MTRENNEVETKWDAQTILGIIVLIFAVYGMYSFIVNFDSIVVFWTNVVIGIYNIIIGILKVIFYIAISILILFGIVSNTNKDKETQIKEALETLKKHNYKG